jgi:molecular chaperone DnaK
MKRDAEAHADEDKKKREFADAKVDAENKLFSLEKLLKESGDKVSAADRGPVEKAMEKVREATKGTDLAAIKSAVSELDQLSQAMAQHLYSQPGAAGGPPPGATPSGEQKKGGDDVIDAEYEVKK